MADKAKPPVSFVGSVIVADSMIMPPVTKKIAMPSGVAKPAKSSQENLTGDRANNADKGTPKGLARD